MDRVYKSTIWAPATYKEDPLGFFSLCITRPDCGCFRPSLFLLSLLLFFVSFTILFFSLLSLLVVFGYRTLYVSRLLS